MDNNKDKTILLVEDDVFTAIAMRNILLGCEFDVIIANTGEGAIEMINKGQKVDMILMDMEFGSGMDGAEAAKIILNDHDIPLIFVSAHTDINIVEKTRGIKSYGYIAKNTGEAVLNASVRMAFQLFEDAQKLKKQEEELFKRESFLRMLTNSGKVMLWSSTRGEGCIYFNQPWLDFTGRELDKELGRGWFHGVHPDDRERIVNIFKNSYNNYQEFNIEYRIKHQSGEYRWIEDYGIPRHDKDGNFIGYIGHCIDIHDRKTAEISLKASEERNTALLNAIPDLMFVMDKDTKIIDYNKNKSDDYLIPPSEFLNKKLSDTLPRELYSKGHESIINVFETGKYQNFQYPLIFKEKYRYYDARLVPMGDDKILAIIRDISEQKIFEKKLKKQNAFVNAVFNSIQDGISVLDTDFNIMSVNNKMKELYSHMLPLEGKKCYHAYHNREKKCSICPTSRAYKSLKLESDEVPIAYSDGNYGTLELFSFPIIDDNEKLIGIVEYVRDITERKKMQNAIKEAYNIISTILDSIDAIIYVSDMESYEILHINKYAREIFGDITGRLCHKAIQNRKSPCDFCTNHLLIDENGNPNDVHKWEFKNLKNNIWYLCQDKAIKWIDDRLVRLETAIDITDRKESEEQIEKLLKEKEMILKEVHHRIKNNMNIIYSILSLQGKALKDQISKKIIEDAAGRTQRMTLLYDKLYTKEYSAKINIKIFLEELMKEIISLFYRHNPVKTMINIDDIYLDGKILSSVSIIINELITNTMKHSFADGIEDTISFSAVQDKDQIKVIYSDNGISMPETANPEGSETFGLKLINILIRQIRGNYEIDRTPGNKYTIKFPID